MSLKNVEPIFEIQSFDIRAKVSCLHAYNADGKQVISNCLRIEKCCIKLRGYQYDAVGRIAVVVDPMGKHSETRTYTNNGLLETITDARGNTTEYEYDGFDRLKKRIYPDATFEEYTYNANNQVLTLTTRAGDVITNTYDVLTRLETRDPDSLPLQTMTYDLAGRLLKLNTPSTSDPTSGDYEWGYDTAGRLTLQKMPDAREVEYELDENGNKTKLIWPDSYYVEYFYDELNRLTDIKLNGSGTAAVHFDYDDLSRRTLVTYENGCTCSYSWEINDDLETLEHTFDSSSVAWAFAYNKVHQVTSKSVDNADFAWPSPTAFSKKKYGSANSLNQYPSVDGSAQDYDDNGNLTSGVLTATFDVLNRMTQAILGGTTVDFIYDPNNRQAQKSVSSVDTGFLYDGVQLIAEYDGATLEKRYIPGILPDEVLMKIESSTKTYFHKDRLGSVIAVTDASGDVLNRFNYGPFGETPSLTGTPFGYTGQRFDAELQAYYYKARYYSPAIGRFLSPDPIGFDAGDMNLYAYVGNDAVNLTDPEGTVGQALLSNEQGPTFRRGPSPTPTPQPPEFIPFPGQSQQEQLLRILAEHAQANAYQAYAAKYMIAQAQKQMKLPNEDILPSGNMTKGRSLTLFDSKGVPFEMVEFYDRFNGRTYIQKNYRDGRHEVEYVDPVKRPQNFPQNFATPTEPWKDPPESAPAPGIIEWGIS